MTRTVTIDPITRIEGHLAVHIDVDEGFVKSARCSGEMYRGFEHILKGRDPLDAQQIAQRICGVCPVSHGTASIFAQDMAFKVRPTKNGRIARNLILAANYLQSHIIHFYQLAALDFVDISAILSYDGTDSGLAELKSWAKAQVKTSALFPLAPFLPRYEGRYVENQSANISAIKNYLDALEMRKLAHKMAAVFAGKMPHPATLVPGGVTEKITVDKIAAYASMLKKLAVFINKSYLPDVESVAGAFPEYLAIGKYCGSALCYGNFPQADDRSHDLFPSGVLVGGQVSALDQTRITESVATSLFSSQGNLHPFDGQTVPAPDKEHNGAYSWLKAPRYNGLPMEVGPLPRVIIAYKAGNTPGLNSVVDSYLKKLGVGVDALFSTLGRHLTRAIEAKVIAERIPAWLDELEPGKPAFQEFRIPDTGRGYGLMEAPRGALGHWIEVKDKKIANYQCVVPTTWNCSPRDDKGVAGPVEQALVGTPVADPQHPIEAARVVRAFDPCLACAVH